MDSKLPWELLPRSLLCEHLSIPSMTRFCCLYHIAPGARILATSAVHATLRGLFDSWTSPSARFGQSYACSIKLDIRKSGLSAIPRQL